MPTLKATYPLKPTVWKLNLKSQKITFAFVLVLAFFSGCDTTTSDLPARDGGNVNDVGVADLGTDLTLSGDDGVLAPDMATLTDMAEGPPHEALLAELIGFGQGTTGGAGGPVVDVTTLADSGPGSLRDAATSNGPAWIRFMVSGVISLETEIEVSSDKTIDGRGADITITGDGLFVQNGEGNVIINNIKIRDTSNDMIRFYNGGSNMWVHKCDLSNGGDGAFDATEGVTGVTVSYTHIFDHDKAMLIGAGSDDGDGDTMRWTGHHNWYDNAVQRLPAIRFGQAHSYNNLIEWISGTAMSTRLSPSQMLVENNILAPQTNVGHKVISAAEDRGDAKFVGNLERPLPGDVIEFAENNPEAVFNPLTSYTYSADPADEALDTKIRAQAGWQDVPFPE